MKRHANPDIPLPVLLVGAAAVGGAIVWWITRPKTNDVPVTARQPIAVSEPMAIMGGGNAGCVPITVEPISGVQAPPHMPQIVMQSDVILSPEDSARQIAENNLTPAQRAVFSSSLEALNKRTSQLQATRPDRVREAALRGITERQVIEAARREYDSAYDELLRQAAQLK